ncbi:MAG: sulfatase [Verrucomicrobiales bacterium]
MQIVRYILPALCGLILSMSVSAVPASTPPSANTPMNILFIFCDDLGWFDLGSYGSTFYETPNIDRLAREGMRFINAYASSNVCSPSRASVMTGKYPSRVGLTQYLGGHNVGQLCDVPYFDRLPASEYTLASALKDRANYQTWHVGKWHLGEWKSRPEAHGFEINIAGCERGGPGRVGYFSPWNNAFPNLPDREDGENLTDRLNEEAIRLIRERDPTRPFYLNYWPYAVHTPLQAPEPLIEKYREKARRLGLDQEEDNEIIGEMETLSHLGKPIHRRKFQNHPVYAAMVENLDTNIGLLIEALESEGLMENTLIVFSSDNGGLATGESFPTHNGPLSEGKGWMYEGGVREPLIAYCPGVVPSGVASDALTITPDFYPTFLEFAGLDPLPHQHVDGVSIAPILRGERQTFDRGPVFWHYPHYSNQGGKPASAIREGDWKLIQFYEDGQVELYNLADDLGEQHNLADAEPAIRDRLERQLQNWIEATHALIPQHNSNWPPTAFAHP